METKLKQRILGGVVIAAVAVIVIPLFLGHNNKPTSTQQVTLNAQIPPAPTPPTLSMNDSNAPTAIQAQEAQQLNPQGVATANAAAAANSDGNPTPPNAADASQNPTAAQNPAAASNSPNSVTDMDNASNTPNATGTQPAFNPAATVVNDSNVGNNANVTSNVPAATSGQQPAFNPSANNAAPTNAVTTQPQAAASATAPAVTQTSSKKKSTTVAAARQAATTNNYASANTNNTANVSSSATPVFVPNTANNVNNAQQTTLAQQNGGAPIVQATPVYVRGANNPSVNAPVVAQQVTPAQKAAVKQYVADNKNTQWSIQVGSFSKTKNAQALASKLKSSGLDAYTQTIHTNRGESTRVLIGPEGDRARAEAIVAVLSRKYQINAVVVPYKAQQA